MNKKVIGIITVTSLLVIISIGLYLYTRPSNPFSDLPFICAHPKNALIQNGQNKKTITEIMGQANKEIVKSDINESRFGQGNIEKKIKEGWIYIFNDWEGNIQIYFNEDGTVIRKSCGSG